MIHDVPLDTQLAAQADDRLRVLVVGAGIAGLTIAQMLRRDGLHPVLIDRSPIQDHPGYMLALMPAVDQAFEDLGVRAPYRAAAVPLTRFRFRSHRGAVLRTDDLGPLMDVHGDYQGIARGALMDVLTAPGCPMTTGLTVSSVSRTATGSRVELVARDGEAVAQETFDLVIGADGIGSRMRGLLDAPQAQTLRTGWSGWVAWAPLHGDAGLAEETWGDGFFLGAYPVRDRLGVFLGGPDADLDRGREQFCRTVRARLPRIDARLTGALDAIAAQEDPYRWRMDDARSPRWVMPRGILLGDAAAGFLPTAGIGAGMAIESAWMLGRILAHADREELPVLLEAWEAVERPRVEAAHGNSRSLARLMFRRSRLVALAREEITRRLSVRAALGPILGLLESRPDPDEVARAALARRGLSAARP